MSKKPFFSVITVTLNSTKTLDDCLNSIFNQNFSNWEIIIIDGKSNDGTVDLIKKYESKISYWVSEEDSGIYEAMNKGVVASKAKYVYFLNSDDQFHDEDVLKDIYSSISSKNRVDVLTANVEKVYPTFKVLKNNRLTKKNLRKCLMPPHQSMFISKEIFNKVGGNSLKYKASGDFKFCCKLLETDIDVIYVDRLIADFKSGGMSSHKEIAYLENYQIIKEFFGIYYATLYYFKKIIVEQNIKNLFKLLKLNKLIDFSTMLIMKISKDKK